MVLWFGPGDQLPVLGESRPRVNDLIEAIHYQSTSPAAGSKTINYALTDAELETVNQSLALTITGTQAPTITRSEHDAFGEHGGSWRRCPA
jgi:hypothetical protein